MNLSEAANRVIALASKVYDYYSTELPKRFPHYPVDGLAELRKHNIDMDRMPVKKVKVRKR
jgi:hypothetical protein